MAAFAPARKASVTSLDEDVPFSILLEMSHQSSDPAFLRDCDMATSVCLLVIPSLLYPPCYTLLVIPSLLYPPCYTLLVILIVSTYLEVWLD